MNVSSASLLATGLIGHERAIRDLLMSRGVDHRLVGDVLAVVHDLVERTRLARLVPCPRQEEPPLKLLVWHDGDSSVGLSGDRAAVEVDMAGYPADHVAEFTEELRDALADAFGSLWDAKVNVQTAAELVAAWSQHDS